MKSIIDYIIEYKTVASHNSEKSIGDPDKINHYFMQGFTSMKFGDKTAYPFIYNKKNNKIVFGKCGNTHPQLLRELSNVIKKELDILDVNSIQQLRYCCGMDDDKKEIDNWYSKNKQWVDNIICGRIWNRIKINEWPENYIETAKVFDKLSDIKSAETYIANWNEIEPSVFIEINNNIINKFISKTGNKIESYIAIDNNGEPIEIELNKHNNIKIDKRDSAHKNELEKNYELHVNPNLRKLKWKLTAPYRKTRNNKFQNELYNKETSKTAAEFHNNKTQKYNPITGKTEWVEKIGDNLNNMKDIKTFILESGTNEIKTDLSTFDLTKIPEDSGIEIDELKGYDGPDYKRYEYFGDCINTVEKDKMWDATQMAGQIRKSKLVDINNVLDKLCQGDRRIPVKLSKTIEQLKRNNKIDDLSEICCGMDSYQRIMFIYLSKTDTHYFFDCIK